MQSTHITKRPHGPSVVAVFMSAHNKTPYISLVWIFLWERGSTGAQGGSSWNLQRVASDTDSCTRHGRVQIEEKGQWANEGRYVNSFGVLNKEVPMCLISHFPALQRASPPPTHTHREREREQERERERGAH